MIFQMLSDMVLEEAEIISDHKVPCLEVTTSHNLRLENSTRALIYSHLCYIIQTSHRFCESPRVRLPNIAYQH
jgi:hypothetical protein